MIEQSAKVVRIDENKIYLEAQRESTCSGCKLKQGCGTGLLSKHIGRRFSQISVNKTHTVVIGQQVQLAIPEQSLLQGALLMYILPLLLMFLMAGVAQLLNYNDLIEIFAGLTGLLIGFYWVKVLLHNKQDGFQAQIVKDQK